MFRRCFDLDEEEKKELRSRVDANCEEASRFIHDADVILLITGAGFSADSGLAVYGDVAQVDAYKKLGLAYHDICCPEWLSDDPSLFYGFWGQCFNDYRNTQPHEGYEIIAKWRDDKNQRNGGAVADQMRSYTKQQEQKQKHKQNQKQVRKQKTRGNVKKEVDYAEPYKIEGRAGAFFAYTSNVDAHSFDVFQASEIRECHGNIELWQCPNYKCEGNKKIWRAPFDYRFEVDQETMKASRNQQFKDKTNEHIENLSFCEQNNHNNHPQENEEEENVARVGHTFGGKRRNPLQYMEALNEIWQVESKSNESNNSQWSTGWPKCDLCNRDARPAILMFGDYEWTDNKAQSNRWSSWKDALYAFAADIGYKQQQQLRVVVLEIGCGINVPTCRYQSEETIRTLNRFGENVNAKLVRINPDFPIADDDDLSEYTISIMSRGLRALKKINKKKTC